MILTHWRAQIRDSPSASWRTISTHEDLCEIRKRLLYELLQHAGRALDGSDLQTAVEAYVARERVNAGALEVVVDRSSYRIIPPGPALPYVLTLAEADELIRFAASFLTGASTGRSAGEVNRGHLNQEGVTPDLERLGRYVYARIHPGADGEPIATAEPEAAAEAKARVNLHKHRCRSHRCTDTANYLAHDGFCGYYLCARHTERNPRRMAQWQRDRVILIPIAQTPCDGTDAEHPR